MRTNSLLLAFLFPLAAPAQEAAPAAAPVPPPPPYKGSLEAGATRTSGNTEVETYTGALTADASWRGWGLALRGSGVYAETRDVQTAGAWDASLRGDRALLGVLGIYTRVSIDGDRFKGFESRKGAGGGLSVQKKWAARGPVPADMPSGEPPAAGYDRVAARAELGYQYYREDLVGTTVDNEVQAARAFGAVSIAISKETFFTEEVEALYDFEAEDRYLVTSVTSLVVKLRRNLALKISQTVKIDTEPPYRDPANRDLGRFEEVDTLSASALIVTF